MGEVYCQQCKQIKTNFIQKYLKKYNGYNESQHFLLKKLSTVRYCTI